MIQEGISVSGCRALIQAGRHIGLHHYEGGRIVGVKIGEISHNRAGKGAYAGLNEHVGGAVAAVIFQLFAGLHCHGAVALHDPGGDLLVAVPGGILNDHAPLGLIRFLCGQTHAVVIVHFLNVNLSAFLCDVLKAGLSGTLGHMYDRLLA